MNELLIKQLQPFILAFSFLLIYIAEHIFPQRTSSSLAKHDVLNALVGVFNGIVIFIGGYFFQQLITWLNKNNIGLLYLVRINSHVKTLLQLLLIDLFMYWWHRLNHHISFLWRFHQFHHTDTAMNSTTALRFHVVELSFSYVARIMVFPILGITLNSIILYSLLFFPIVILHHSNIKISARLDQVFRKLFVTPHMHRIHHSRIPTETNSNYSSLFPFWDLLFKTYRKKPSGIIDFGI
ncbi:MAG: sterol desaturase family protein [Bacteroidota bacterium]